MERCRREERKKATSDAPAITVRTTHRKCCTCRREFTQVGFERHRPDFLSVAENAFETIRRSESKRLPSACEGRRSAGAPPRISAIARKRFPVRRIQESGHNVLLGVQRRQQFLGRGRIVKRKRCRAIGAEDVRQHLHIVPHRVAALHLVVDQQPRAAEQRSR